MSNTDAEKEQESSSAPLPPTVTPPSPKEETTTPIAPTNEKASINDEGNENHTSHGDDTPTQAETIQCNPPVVPTSPQPTSPSSISTRKSLKERVAKMDNDDSDPWSAEISDEDDPKQTDINAIINDENNAKIPNGNSANINLRSRFASWRSKADAVIQKSEVLKAAQKNIVAKSMDVSKVVQQNLVKRGVNVNGQGQGQGQNQMDVDDDAVGRMVVVDATSQDSTDGKKGDTKHGEEEVEDDLSYDDNNDEDDEKKNDGQKLVQSPSEASSIYVEEDDEISINSDESSVGPSQTRRPSPIPKTKPSTIPLFSALTNRAKKKDEPVTTAHHRGRYESDNNDPKAQKRRNIIQQISKSITEHHSSSTDNYHYTHKRAAMETTEAAKESQTSLILKSSAASHMQSILSSLHTGQYVMLLGQGMLGVNLKQTYATNGGVYVDFIVPGGNAAKAGVIGIGDSLVKVGNVDVGRGTIADVPGIIGASKRPVVLVLNGEHSVNWEKMDYVTVAVGMVNRIREEGKRGISTLPISTKSENSDSDSVSLGSAGDGRLSPPPPPPSQEEVGGVGLVDGVDLRSNSSLLDTEEEPDAGEVDADKVDCKSLEGNRSGDGDDCGTDVKNDVDSDAAAAAAAAAAAVAAAVLPVTSTKDKLNDGSERKDEEKENSTTPAPIKKKSSKKRGSSVRAYSYHRQNANSTNLPSPSRRVRKSLAAYAAKRNNQMASFSALSLASQNDPEFRQVLREAFVTCCSDSRRLPFLAAYLSSEDAFETNAGGTTSGRAGQPTGSTRLMLYLELISYRDLFGVTPKQRRLNHAKRIVYKFLLYNPKTFEAPKFDMRSLFSLHFLENLESVIVGAERGLVCIERDFFREVETVLENSLAGTKFAFFLISDECARMRAYMRGTNPYVDTPIEVAVKEAVSLDSDNIAVARNHLLYMLLYLICQSENETLDKNFEKDANNNADGITPSKRIMGSAGGISCAVFIHRKLLPCIKTANELFKVNKEKLENESVTREGDGANTEEIATLKELIAASEHLWEAFVAPAGGMLDSLSHSNETQETLDKVRRQLVAAVSPPANLSKDEKGYHIARALATNPHFTQSLICLSEELIYDYAVNSHPKYRGHMFHEWMCGEVNKALYGRRASAEQDDSSSSSEEEIDCVSVPPLLNGCISRLMRRVELPKGVSRHRPFRVMSDNVDLQETNRDFNDRLETYDEDSTHASQFSLDSLNRNAECAVIFGTDYELDGVGLFGHEENIRRFASVSLLSEDTVDNTLNEDIIPSTLESYAIVPSLRQRPFYESIYESRVSDDGWEVSLINFMIPNANNVDASTSAASLYGVSLVFNKNPNIQDEAKEIEECKFNVEVVNNESYANGSQEDLSHNRFDDALLSDGSKESPLNVDDFPCAHLKTTDEINHKHEKFHSPIACLKSQDEHGNRTTLRFQASADLPEFNRLSKESCWSDRLSGQENSDQNREGTIGIALVSGSNVIPAMRKTLTCFFQDVSSNVCHGDKRKIWSPIVNMLGIFSSKNVEATALPCILDRYLKFGASSWIDRPLSHQKECFNLSAGEALVKSLPPIPLALLFITALLEQKIVFSSSRRSILLSTSIALHELLKPLQWTHLFVPLVPAALAADLVQYPAPFILGIPSEAKGSMELLDSLPEDVTLVDLDVGRVILAKSFSHDFGLLKGSKEVKLTVTALRSQVLYLAEALGGVFAANRVDETWLCDSPVTYSDRNNTSPKKWNKNTAIGHFKSAQKICRAFIKELLVGANTCCFWIEEESGQNREIDCDVLFDEDRFFHIKNLRAQGCYMPLLMGEKYFVPAKEKNDGASLVLDSKPLFALSLDDFDLVLETFLRGQQISSFISSWKKEAMAFW